jgi:hypothetical protein
MQMKTKCLLLSYSGDCSGSRNNTEDYSFKLKGEMVVFKIPVEHNGGNVVPTVETIL